jgi:hypothetical protein
VRTARHILDGRVWVRRAALESGPNEQADTVNDRPPMRAAGSRVSKSAARR